MVNSELQPTLQLLLNLIRNMRVRVDEIKPRERLNSKITYDDKKNYINKMYKLSTYLLS